jgi:alkanesulfonate monooxygenase SsuD/methylene tetrahydromethanopterin reductase-like flavin-dependent oxidoreductase (luciferase family)
VVTLPLENVVRVAEDAIVTDLLSGGRLELGLGSGSTPASFAAFGVDPSDRTRIYEAGVQQLLAALDGQELAHPENHLYPAGHSLLDRVWQATFSSFGGVWAGVPGHGLLLSRTQPRPEGEPDLPLEALQQPIVDAYLATLPQGVAPRILASRTLLVTDTEAEAKQYLQDAWERYLAKPGTGGFFVEADSARTWARRTDTHIGTPDQVVASLLSDPIIPSRPRSPSRCTASIQATTPPCARSNSSPGRSPRRSAGRKHLSQRKQAATPQPPLGSHDRMGSEIGY